MKLIDILVRELPHRGGWPNGGAEITQDADGCLCIWKLHGAQFNSGYWSHSSGVGLLQYWSGMNAMPCSEDGRESIITKDKYESALAASRPEWDGDGLPPVGSKVSFFYNDRYNYNEEIIPQDGQELEVVAHKTTTDEHEVAVCYWDEDGGGMAVCLVPGSLRPIRSEAVKKRDEAIESIKAMLMYDYGDDPRLNDAVILYDAIAAGKIPHIRID